MYHSISEYIADDPSCRRHTTASGSGRHISYPDHVTLRRDSIRNENHDSSRGTKYRLSAPAFIPDDRRRDVTTYPYVAMTGSERRPSRSDVNSSEEFYVEISTPKPIKQSDGIVVRGLSKTVSQSKVRQARNLRSGDGTPCTAYIKVSMEPDDTKLTRCSTDVIRQNNHPVFEEKFSFELLEDDFKKRVLISVLNTKTDESEPEILGGMSFGVWHVYTQRKKVDGWYYLLDKDLANRKHVRVTSVDQRKHRTDINNVNNGVHHTIGNRKQNCAEDFTHFSAYKAPLGTSTPQKHRRRSEIRVSSISCLQLIEEQRFINRRYCNDWEFVYDMSARRATGQTEGASCEDGEQHVKDGRGFDLNIPQSAHQLHHTTGTRAERNKKSRDGDDRMTSSKAVGRAIRECVKKALTTPLKSSSHNRGNFLPDISKISHLDSDSIRLLDTDSSCFRGNSLSGGTPVLTSPEDESAGRANGNSGSKDFEREPREASEDSYIYAVSRACEAFMSRVDGGQRRHGDSSEARTRRGPSHGRASDPTERPPQKHETNRNSACRASDGKENRRQHHDYVNGAIIELHFGEKRKRDCLNVTELGRGTAAPSDLSRGLRCHRSDTDLCSNGTSAMPAPTKRRRVAELSFSVDKRPEAEEKDKGDNRKRTSWRSSFRRVFRARETGSASGEQRSLMAPETRSVENCQQKRFGLVDRMKGLRLGIRNSFSLLTRKDKQAE